MDDPKDESANGPQAPDAPDSSAFVTPTESAEATESNDLVNPRDFISIKLAIEFQNLTASSHPIREDEVALSEIRDRVLVFELPETSCNVEHNVMIKLGRHDAGEDTPILFQSTGKVARVKQLKDGKIRAVVTLVQFDEPSWLGFMALFARRQEEITEFLRQVKP